MPREQNWNCMVGKPHSEKGGMRLKEAGGGPGGQQGTRMRGNPHARHCRADLLLQGLEATLFEL